MNHKESNEISLRESALAVDWPRPLLKNEKQFSFSRQGFWQNKAIFSTTFTFNFYAFRDGNESDPVKEKTRGKKLSSENSAIKIFSNEKFYGYDDGFGIRIKRRSSAIIRRHLWRSIITQCEHHTASRMIFARFFSPLQCKHSKKKFSLSEHFSFDVMMLNREW